MSGLRWGGERDLLKFCSLVLRVVLLLRRLCEGGAGLRCCVSLVGECVFYHGFGRDFRG